MLFRSKTYGYGTAKSREELTARYKKLQLGAVLPQLQKGLSALVYSQLTDVEDEAVSSTHLTRGKRRASVHR